MAHDGVGNTGFDDTDADFAIADPTVSLQPGQPMLNAASDTGLSHSDRITRLNNAAPASSLIFDVDNTIAGATVNLYADGTLIGTAVATGSTTQITTNGSTVIPDGVRSITARQIEPGKTQSGNSLLLSVTIDTLAPTFVGGSFAFETEQRVDLMASELSQLNSISLFNSTTNQTLSGVRFRSPTMTFRSPFTSPAACSMTETGRRMCRPAT